MLRLLEAAFGGQGKPMQISRVEDYALTAREQQILQLLGKGSGVTRNRQESGRHNRPGPERSTMIAPAVPIHISAGVPPENLDYCH
jgi:hypothetical protein